jgi:hypothetical protein
VPGTAASGPAPHARQDLAPARSSVSARRRPISRRRRCSFGRWSSCAR